VKKRENIIEEIQKGGGKVEQTMKNKACHEY